MTKTRESKTLRQDPDFRALSTLSNRRHRSRYNPSMSILNFQTERGKTVPPLNKGATLEQIEARAIELKQQGKKYNDAVAAIEAETANNFQKEKRIA